ncbi:MAG: cellulase family glycosylhydrolase, partial [Candidatus Dormibacteraeota bacterium]|nr:cellulase family glycosylhydrolase [Candidatus Dormibacteraeota bacterium]
GVYSLSWLNQMLDEMKSGSGTTVVRTWFFQSYSSDNYVQLDTVLAAAAQRGIKIVPVLVNQWGDCEPGWGPQGQRPYRTRSWYEGGYRQTNDGYPLSFRDYAINTARRYANNPTVAFWQLVNEAEALDSTGGLCNQAAAGAALRSFADDVTGAIKAVDRNHLVSLGTLGGGQCGIAGPEYTYVHSGAVDICEYHDYGTSAISQDPWNGNAVDIQACAALGKPIFAGEVGIDTASVGPSPTPQVLQGRATLFGAKLQTQFGRGISGFLIWSKTLGASQGLEVGPGDPTEATMKAFQSQLNPAAPPPSAGRGPAPGGIPVAPRGSLPPVSRHANTQAQPVPTAVARGTLASLKQDGTPDRPQASASSPLAGRLSRSASGLGAVPACTATGTPLRGTGPTPCAGARSAGSARPEVIAIIVLGVLTLVLLVASGTSAGRRLRQVATAASA